MKIFRSAKASLAQGAIDRVNETGVRGWMEGVSVSAAVLLNDHTRQQVIDTLSVLHNHSSPAFYRTNTQQAYLVELQKLVLRQSFLTFDVRHALLMLKMKQCVKRLPSVLSHGDLHAGNVLVSETNNKAVLIDWDRWGMLPAGYDEACFLRGMSFEKALSDLPNDANLRLGFAVFSYWLGLAEDVNFRFTEKAKDIARYVVAHAVISHDVEGEL